MKQGEYLHSEPTFKLISVALQTGEHTLHAYAMGAVRTDFFDATATEAFVIPNLFPECGTFRIEIVQPDNELFDDLSGCDMTVCVNLHACAPQFL